MDAGEARQAGHPELPLDELRIRRRIHHLVTACGLVLSALCNIAFGFSASVVAFGLIWMLNGTGNFLLRIIGFHAAEGHATVHSPEELDLLFTQSHEGGQLSQTEREILHRVVKFSDLTARGRGA